MSWSLNEVESLSKKAARGAGMSWGLAEETGKAIRVLGANGINSTEVLADLLTLNDGADYAQIAPQVTGEVWAALGGTLCPIATGAALSDHAFVLKTAELRLGRVAYPMFLIPFAQAAARQTGATMSMQWADLTIYATEGALFADGSTDALTAPATGSVICRIATTPKGHALPGRTRADMSDTTAARLNAFAHRTYAPATEASRLAGAGAGLSDND